MSDDYIDPQRDIISANWSPQLKQVHPVYEPEESPPPILTKDSSDSDESEDVERPAGRRRRRKRPLQPYQSDCVLIRQLEPNRPDIATQALKSRIDAGSDLEEEEGSSESELDEDQMVGYSPNGEGAVVADAKTKGLAAAALEASQKLAAAVTPDDGDFPMFDSGSTRRVVNHGIHSLPNGVHVNGTERSSNGLSSTPQLLPAHRELDLKPPPRPPPLRTDSPHTKRDPNYESNNDEDSIATSPTLAPYTISPEHADPASTLPALQKSPPRLHSTNSPETKQTLPSLTTALSQVSDSNGTPFLCQSPSLSRPSPAHVPHFGRSPSVYSHSSPGSAMSPPSLPSHASHWRSTGRNGSISTPSDNGPNSATISTPVSLMTLQSPATSYPTSTVVTTEQSPSGILDGENDPTPLIKQPSNGNSQSGAPFISSGYQCSVPGCNSSPFQTQYLLNSHMNVHSNTRPHFCPVKGCSRGPGGQGFKRKNEMIRHGLVHTSPGYMCPFCPDQQHKYPRPDNLQRHVKVHHKDRDREDSALRDVLAQRPEGGNRGRRRRLGS